MRIGTPYRIGALTSALIVSGAIAVAQIAEGDGGLRLEAGLSLRVEVDDGDPEFRTGFDVDLISATRTQRLSFSGDFGLTVPLDTFDTEFTEPDYGFGYIRDTGRSRLSFSGNFSRRDVDDRSVVLSDPLDPADPADPEEEGFDEEELTLVEGGTLERRQLSASLQVGQTDPVGAEISYSLDERDYTGTLDPDLLDETRERAALVLRFDVDPTLRLGTSLRYSLSEEDDPLGERDERLRIGLNATWRVGPDVTLGGELAYSRIETEVAGLPVTDRDGLNLRFTADLDRPNGDYGFRYARVLNTLGFVTDVGLSRTVDLARDARLSLSLGATELPSGNTYAVGSIGYNRDTRPGSMSVAFEQSAAVNGSDEEVLRRVLRGSYALDLPREAQLNLSARLTDSEFVLGTEPDIASVRLGVSYSQPLSEDWDFGAGASWRLSREDGASDDTETRLFLTLERNFTLRR